MYALMTQLELVLLLLLLAFGWTAGGRAFRLVYSGSGKLLRRKASGLWICLLLVTALALALLADIAWMVRAYDPVYWQDRLFLHAPLILLPAGAVWIFAAPVLLRLRRAAGDAGEASPQPEARRLAVSPRLIVPFQLTALGALAALYFTFMPPVAQRLAEVAIPLCLLPLASAALWMRHARRARKLGAAAEPPVYRRWRQTLLHLSVVAVIAAAAGSGLTLAAESSRLPAAMSMMAGTADYGGGSAEASGHDHSGAHAPVHGAGTVSVTELTGPSEGEPDRRFELIAQRTTVRLGSGRTVEAWTYNGAAPGPELRMKRGELIEVTLTNRDIEDGVTIHWHGLDVPNAEDGVAGATQNAVMPGDRHIYRFRAEQVGTFWYHSHQNSREAVQKGLFGPLIVEPEDSPAFAPAADITVLTHRWNGRLAIGLNDGLERRTIPAGTAVRLRLIHTDDWIRQPYRLTGAPFRVAAIDGAELHEPDELRDARLVLTTGGRYDITFVMPEEGPVLLSAGDQGKVGLLLSPGDAAAAPVPDIPPPAADFDPLGYGSPAPTPFGPASRFDREFTMVLDNRLGFYNGRFEQLYTINGAVFPDTPMFMVREGDLVKTTIVNRGAVDHPMHLHGHHVLVLSRNGVPASGSPWWSDTLDVTPGDTYEVAFRADNPGIWMDHCHNLTHAAIGMTMHLAYEGVVTPFTIGGPAANHPE